MKLLFKDIAEVDVIEKDRFQGWPEVGSHSFTGDELRAEHWVETAVSVCVFLHELENHLSYPAPPFKQTQDQDIKWTLHFLQVFNKLCSYKLQGVLISLSLYLRGCGHSFSNNTTLLQ